MLFVADELTVTLCDGAIEGLAKVENELLPLGVVLPEEVTVAADDAKTLAVTEGLDESDRDPLPLGAALPVEVIDAVDDGNTLDDMDELSKVSDALAVLETDALGDSDGDVDTEKTATTEADTEGVALPDTSADGSALAALDVLTLGVSELE